MALAAVERSEPARLRVGVVVATLGRPCEVAELISWLKQQTQQPARVIVSATRSEDVASVREGDGIEILLGSAGSCVQRNRAMDLLMDQTEVICFLDDDYLPSRFAIEAMSEYFADHAEVVGVTGLLLADGIHGAAVPFDVAESMITVHDGAGRSPVRVLQERTGLYGCNMAFRTAAIGAERFDERLPLYGWQEDLDLSARIGSKGRMVEIDGFAGVHRGVKGGRSSGVRVGYSQIANPAYLWRKGTMTLHWALKISVNNFLANHLKSLRPEPWIDRWGRVKGNWLAIADLLRTRIDPERILRL